MSNEAGLCEEVCVNWPKNHSFFNYAGIEDGVKCRCGDMDALLSYIQVEKVRKR